MKAIQITGLSFLLALASAAQAQEPPANEPPAEQTEQPRQAEQVDPSEQAVERTFDDAVSDIEARLETSITELAELRQQIEDEMLPLSGRLSELRAELAAVQREYQEKARARDRGTLAKSKLRTDTEARRDELEYVSTRLLTEYVNNFDPRLHISEKQRYDEVVEAARLAPDDSNLSDGEIYATQAKLLSVGLDRLEEALGGTRFEGTALDSSRFVNDGTFVLVGPMALFRSADGANVGAVEERLGSQEPTQIPFGNPEDTAAAGTLVANGSGFFPVDPTLGNAFKVEATQETLLEHIQAGGPVMYPIFTLAGLALLIAIYKFIALLFVRTPSRKKIAKLLDAVRRRDEEGAKQAAGAMRGPVGAMLSTGVEHIREPRELIEEVMYENVLVTKLKVNRMLPFIAICAASAPLLGLLGTVTGIIDTFAMITVYGSGDVRMLSGGISEALITTKFGLIVAVPSLLMHAFLSRKARGVIGKMEQAAVALTNQIGRTPFDDDGGSRRDEMTPMAPPPAEPHEPPVPVPEREARELTAQT